MSNKMVSEESTRFDGSIPEMYDQHLGELLFEPYAADIADRVAKRRPRKVLEIAAGTGIASRRLLKALPRGTALTVTDLNTPMLEYAQHKIGADGRGAEWRQADAQDLPFPNESFDAVVCQFGVMFFPDKHKGLREFNRVLEKGGALIFNVWDSLERNPIGMIMHSTIGKSESPESAALGLVRGNPVINTIRERGTANIDEIVRAVARAVEERFGARPLRVPLRAHVVSAVKP